MTNILENDIMTIYSERFPDAERSVKAYSDRNTYLIIPVARRTITIQTEAIRTAG
jgi:hypothetical protein